MEDGLNMEAFKDIEEAAEYRKTIEYMTKEKIRKTPKNVIWQTNVAKKKKTRGSREETIYRFLIAFLLQENMQSKLGGKQITYKEISVKIRKTFLIILVKYNVLSK